MPLLPPFDRLGNRGLEMLNSLTQIHAQLVLGGGGITTERSDPKVHHFTLYFL